MNNQELSIEEIRTHCSILENRIIDLYFLRKTQKEICSALNIKRHTIDNLVKRYKLGRFRDRKQSYCKNINPEDPKFWYFLGVFASDGNLYLKSNSVDTIQFTMDDADALNCIRDILNCTNQVKKYNKLGKERFYLSISDASLIKTVREIFHSDCYRKTQTLIFPAIKNKEQMEMFLRGFSDGDGSFAKSRITGFYNFKVFCASKKFIQELYKILISIVNERVHLYKDAYIEVSAQKQVYLLCKYLYSNNLEIGIKRKQERAMQHIRNYEVKI